MATCAHINLSTGIVENIIVADPAIDPPWPGYLLKGNLPSFVQIGTKWDGANFIPPPQPPPSTHTVTGASSQMKVL